MTPRFDFAASMLLCSEDSTTIFDLEEEESEEISWVLRPPSRHADASGALLIDFPLQSESYIEELLEREEEHLPMEGYAQRLLQQLGGSDLVAVRSAAIAWIWKVSRSLLISLIRGVQEKIDGDALSKIILAHSVELILSASKAAEFMVFRPSEIAASVALVALGKHDSSVLKSMATCCKQLRKERIFGCYEVIQEKIVMGNIILKSLGSSVSTEQHSPIGVLDIAARESQQSEGLSAGVPIVHDEGPSASKRRRICR
ncbi:Cyclin-D3-1 [Dichanthelium oligosanthes]|uniref:Cyclin-D3-1 n=1 Tax=Dichanthelium oligosanthes TaxID=888268 RepID=A0A1E5V9C3_9POAL|nr:Cyclin-D3-1 [Dichanthelium oligosanthes]